LKNLIYSEDLQVIYWFLKPYRVQTLFIFVLMFVYAFLEASSVGAFYPLLNSTLTEGSSSYADEAGGLIGLFDVVLTWFPESSERIVSTSIVLLVLFIGSNLFGFIADSYTTWYRYKLYSVFLDNVYDKLIHNHYRYFLDKKQGDLVYVGINAAQSVGEMLLYFPKIGVELFRIIMITVLLFSISMETSMGVFGIILFFGLFIHFLAVKVIHPNAVRLQNSQSELTSLFSESISGIRQIKIFNTEKSWVNRYSKQTNNSRICMTKQMIYTYIPQRAVPVIGVSFIVLGILYCKLYLPDEFATILPILAIYVVALQKLMPAITNIGNHWMGLKSLSPRLKLTQKTLTDKEYFMKNIDDGEALSSVENGVQLEKLSFSYTSSPNILNNISIDIPVNKTIAIVGESGSGKSTLADILMRLHEPTSGQIKLAGVLFSDFSISSWLEHVTMVSQDTFIFHDSIAENIRMGKLDATIQEVIDAAKVANAHQFIQDLPQGYDTVVGDRGMKLSGGQRQRIAIARTVVKNPQVLILDEATSALDNISEKTVQTALNKASKNRTNIIIAHRLSTIEHADKIVLLDKGRVVEQGTHQELLNKHGAYHAFYLNDSQLLDARNDRDKKALTLTL
jgi:ABC-type multidrug transport system fused ATPase/permease subunit